MVNCLTDMLAKMRSKMYRCILAAALFLVSPSLWAEYGVQVAAYSCYKESLAAKEAQSLRAAGFPVEMRCLAENGHKIIRIIVGPYSERREAADVLARLKAAGKDGFIRTYHSEYVREPQAASQQQTDTPIPRLPPLSLEAKSPLSGEVRVSANDDTRAEASSAPSSQAPAGAETAPAGGQGPDDELLFSGEGQGARESYRLSGFFHSKLAYTWPTPQHLSAFTQTLDLAAQGHLTGQSSWKLSGRAVYDAVFDLNNFYPKAVEQDQRWPTSLRETFVDIPAEDWDFRLGRQQIIWGEMVGLFFADVVSAKDLREFVLPEFDMLRIPQWAARGEYFRGNFHGEGIWIPYPSYDEIGVPGSEFYPYPAPPPPGYGMIFAEEHKPAGSLGDSNYGVRFSYLVESWDLSGFYYSSMDTSATFFREVVTAPQPVLVFRPDHDRIRQLGGTLSKDFDAMVLKAEMIYTLDRWYEVQNLSDADGVVRKDALDYIVGLDYTLPQDSRLNLQFFQRWFPSHDADMSAARSESGASIYISTVMLEGKLEPQLLLMGSINRGDWLARPKLVWTMNGNWRWVTGVDLFGGSRSGLFGRYYDKDRVYTEVRYAF